jgi:CHAT domain-containing protein
LATLWFASDTAVVPLIDDFYTYLSNGTQENEALRKAQMNAIAKKVSPANWAEFILVSNTF